MQEEEEEEEGGSVQSLRATSDGLRTCGTDVTPLLPSVTKHISY